MADHLTQSERSDNMGRIRCKDTAPERMVRSLLHQMGFRFRLHQAKLPGNPDLVLPKYGAAVFVHGCFWHRHEGCRRGQSMPSTRPEFWKTKFEKNLERDRVVRNALKALGWKIIIVWECEIKQQNMDALEARLLREIHRTDMQSLIAGNSAIKKGVPQ